MAKVTAICTCAKCGKEFKKVAFKYHSREAEDWEKWAMEYYTVCDDCMQAEREERAAELAEIAKSKGLPELVGSPKQITWAEQIRDDALKDITKELEKAYKSLEQTANADIKAKNTELYKEFKITESYIRSQDSASWWINHKDYSGFNFIRNFRELAVFLENQKTADEG